MYKDTVTVFNRVPLDEGDKWIPTVLRDVELQIDRAAILSKYGAESNDSARLHIRYFKSGSSVMVGGKEWRQPKAWSRTEDQITFTSGSAFDFFWKGEWPNSEVILDTDYGPGGFYEYMDREHDDVFAISSVSVKKLIPHIEILGR